MAKRAFCALPGTFYEPTEEQILDELRECIENYPEDREWFIAQGYTTPAMSDDTLTREFLDELIPDKPGLDRGRVGPQCLVQHHGMEPPGLRVISKTPLKSSSVALTTATSRAWPMKVR